MRRYIAWRNTECDKKIAWFWVILAKLTCAIKSWRLRRQLWPISCPLLIRAPKHWSILQLSGGGYFGFGRSSAEHLVGSSWTSVVIDFVLKAADFQWFGLSINFVSWTQVLKYINFWPFRIRRTGIFDWLMLHVYSNGHGLRLCTCQETPKCDALIQPNDISLDKWQDLELAWNGYTAFVYFCGKRFFGFWFIRKLSLCGYCGR